MAVSQEESKEAAHVPHPAQEVDAVQAEGGSPPRSQASGQATIPAGSEDVRAACQSGGPSQKRKVSTQAPFSDVQHGQKHCDHAQDFTRRTSTDITLYTSTTKGEKPTHKPYTHVGFALHSAHCTAQGRWVCRKGLVCHLLVVSHIKPKTCPGPTGWQWGWPCRARRPGRPPRQR